MYSPGRDDFDFHCKNCEHNQEDYWCLHFGCNPYHALIFCAEDGFENKKEDK